MRLFRAFLLVCCVVIVYVLYEVGWGDDTPNFFKATEEYSGVCYLERGEGHRGPVAARSTDGGWTAVVASEGREVTMTFVSGGLAGDHYEGEDGSTMKIDPEIYIDGIGPSARGPCQ
jgi:hypothetical protein